MKSYKVFQHPDGRIEAVKQGWSWPAFFFGIIWAIIKRLWGLVGILCGLAVLLFFISLAFDPISSSGYYSQSQLQSAAALDSFLNILAIVVSIVLGRQGNKLRELNLTKKGYQLIHTVDAENPDKAIAEAKTTHKSDASINI
ncbi:hypothetical protein A9G13_05175 [Gilliamella sp. wkB178]|uniref:DUF2628 domain-containing protein n=1 Tax=Gilliamella sp. wkB178 TaxID=3120259 RepID=UPI00080E1472|nr:DUF2628 domain-containing protein [Gilliamella apicola]OCG07622.1 hypothetical protein A9G13_05175 [Gilliamella apicola]